MFEFEAYSSGSNVALEGFASQSSTYRNIANFDAASAIDGKVRTFSHTEADQDTNGVWSIDLDRGYDIERIVIRNRWCMNPTDPTECLCRLSFATLTLRDESSSIVAQRTIGNTCKSLTVAETFELCPSPTTPSVSPIVLSDM
jgi:hypothetical protein